MKKEILCQGKFMRLVKVNSYEFLERQNCSGIVLLVPLTDQNEIVLVEQFRQSVNRKMIELPAGLVGDEARFEGENLEEAARRELLEETGYEAKTLEYLGDWPPSSGASAEILSAYIARGLEKKTAGGGDESEKISVHVIPLAKVKAWLFEKQKAGFYIDPKIYAGLYFAIT